MFFLPDTADATAIIAEAKALGEWQQKVHLGVSVSSPGLWSSQDIAKVLFHEFSESFWRDKRVLDIGANTGGLSLELLRRGAIVTAAEPLQKFRCKIDWWKSILCVPDDRLLVTDTKLFKCGELGSFDIVLCLGLVYHFRHPQLVLDYVGNIDAKHFIFSTQTFGDDRLVMINRNETNPRHTRGDRLGGWHPSRSLFLKMLATAGFSNPRQINHPSVLHDWGATTQTTTNSGYFAAEAGQPIDVKAESERFL